MARLLDVIGGDLESLQELIDEFDRVAPEIADNMRRAVEASDMDRLRISAHTLKSNSRDFGASTLSALCEKLEQACRDGTVSEPAVRVAEIVGEVDAARSALAEMRIGNE
jgi:HPt (histidine-containing phosphotransfer) domain-containing protein